MVGAGFVGQIAHLANYAALPACRVVALAEMRPELRRRVAERFAIPHVHATHHDLLADDTVEAVVVVTARPNTGPVALDCLNAGKHVLTEKPMAGTVEQGRRLVAAARKRGVRYMVGYMKRFDDGVVRAKQIFDDLQRTGRLGRLTFVRSHCFMGETYCNADEHIVTDEPKPLDLPSWPSAPEWLSEELHDDYAWFLNVYSHNTNLLRYFLGGTPAVRHTLLASREGGLVVFDFQGVPISLEAGRLTCRHWDETLDVYFEHGRLTVKTPPALLRNTPAQVELYAGDVHEVRSPQCEWRWSFRRQAEAFLRTVREGAASSSPGSDGLEDVRLCEDIWRSEERRRSAQAATSKPGAP
jgi:predicted dehydrogenase